MAIVGEDNRQAAIKCLASINQLSRIGGSDALVNANSTITALCNAIQQLPNLIGHEVATLNQICQGLKLAVLIGAIPETHGVTTIAGLRNLISPSQTLDNVSGTNDFPLYG